MIKQYLKRHLHEFVLSALLSAASAVLSMTLLSRVNQLTQKGNAGINLTNLSISLGLILAMFAANLASQICLARLSAAITSTLRNDLSRHFLALDYSRLLTLGKHVVTAALIADVSRVATLLLVLPQLLFNTLTVVFCVTYLALLSPKLLCLFLALTLLSIASTFLITNKARTIFKRIPEEEQRLFEHFRTIAEGKKELTLSAARGEHFMQNVLGEAIDRNRDLVYSANWSWGLGQAWSSAVTFCMLFCVIYFGQVVLREPVGIIMLFVVAIFFVMGPLNFLVIAPREIMTGLASIRHLESIGLVERPMQSSVKVAPVVGAIYPGVWNSVNARGLEYKYVEDDGHSFKFGPVDFTLHRGETVFIAGGNGSGKSTLALLLTGLVQPLAGSIEVDSCCVVAENVQQYRNLFTGVFFDFYLFSHVIDRNGNVAPDSTINTWLEKLDVHHSVTAVNGELSTLQLSQGQRKRLALTQSYIDDSDIYIFDEWAADQDHVFRTYFYTTLLPELKHRGKTVLAITHDDRYFGIADRVVKLDKGRIASESHEFTG
jgi:cyclic peptide transporter